jgi:hypothetical protein
MQGEDRGDNGDAQDLIMGEEIEIDAEEDKIIKQIDFIH